MTDDERIPDEFEVKARKWAAQERIMEISASFVEHLDLDPELLENLREAYMLSEEWEGDASESPFVVELVELMEAVQAARDQQGREDA
jgi:hypothetical protein